MQVKHHSKVFIIKFLKIVISLKIYLAMETIIIQIWVLLATTQMSVITTIIIIVIMAIIIIIIALIMANNNIINLKLD